MIVTLGFKMAYDLSVVYGRIIPASLRNVGGQCTMILWLFVLAISDVGGLFSANLWLLIPRPPTNPSPLALTNWS